MDNKGQADPRLFSHIFLWIIVAGIGIWLIWSATHTNIENNKYAPGSTSNDNHSTRWPFTIDLNFSCSRISPNKPIISNPEKSLEVQK
jgi:hypothetical protein